MSRRNKQGAKNALPSGDVVPPSDKKIDVPKSRSLMTESGQPSLNATSAQSASNADQMGEVARGGMPRRQRYRRKPHAAATGSVDTVAPTETQGSEEKMPALERDTVPTLVRNTVKVRQPEPIETEKLQPVSNQQAVSLANGSALFAQKTPPGSPKHAPKKSPTSDVDPCEWDGEDTKSAFVLV